MATTRTIARVRSRRCTGTCVAARGGMTRAALVVMLAACAHHADVHHDDAASPGGQPPLGAHYDPDGTGVTFRVASTRATRIELGIYDAPMGSERSHVAMEREPSSDVWRARVPIDQLPAIIYYGYRV